MAHSNWIIEANLRKRVFAKTWAGFKETTREGVNHGTGDSRELLLLLGIKGQFTEPEKMAMRRGPLTGGVAFSRVLQLMSGSWWTTYPDSHTPPTLPPPGSASPWLNLDTRGQRY